MPTQRHTLPCETPHAWGRSPATHDEAWPEAEVPSSLRGLLSRHSIGPRWLVEPPPSQAQLESALACALRAPDHGRLIPWRAVVVQPGQREALGELFATFAASLGRSAEEIDRERDRAAKGPMLVAWIARVLPGIDEVPAHEQWLSAGGALTNFLNAMHLMGFGAKTLSGRKCQHPDVAQAFCGEYERLVAFICVGTPTRVGTPRDRDDVASVWSTWGGAPVSR